MKLFLEKDVERTEDIVNYRLDMVRNYGLNRYARLAYPFIAERLNYWDEIVREQFPAANFNAGVLFKQLHERAVNMVMETAVANSELTARSPIEFGLASNFPGQPKNDSFKYGFLLCDDTKLRNVDSERGDALIPAAMIMQPVYLALKHTGMLNKASYMLERLVFHFGHDLIHSTTKLFLSQPAEYPETFAQMHQLNRVLNAPENSRKRIVGFEDFSVQINKQIFARARSDNSPYYQRTLALMDQIIGFIDELNAAGLGGVAEDFEKFASLIARNTVPRMALACNHYSKWTEVLKTAEIDIKEPTYLIHGEVKNLAEISVMYQRAFIQDMKEQGLAIAA